MKTFNYSNVLLASEFNVKMESDFRGPVFHKTRPNANQLPIRNMRRPGYMASRKMTRRKIVAMQVTLKMAVNPFFSTNLKKSFPCPEAKRA